MAMILFDNQEMSKAERDRQIKERADRIREASRQEAKDGVTISEENDLTFFKER